MPTKDDLTEEMVEYFKLYLQDTYKDYINNRCKSTMRMLLIQLYESTQAIISNKFGLNKSNYSAIKKIMQRSNYLAFDKMRQDLVHNPHNLREDLDVAVNVDVDLYGYIIDILNKVGCDNINLLCKYGCIPNIYNTIICYCKEQIEKHDNEYNKINKAESTKTDSNDLLPQIIGGAYL